MLCSAYTVYRSKMLFFSSWLSSLWSSKVFSEVNVTSWDIQAAFFRPKHWFSNYIIHDWMNRRCSVSTDVYSCLFGAVTSSKEEEMSSKTTLVSVFSDRTWKLRLCFISEVTKLVNVWLRFVHTSTQISRGRFLGSKNWYWFIKMRIGFQSEQCNVEESDESEELDLQILRVSDGVTCGFAQTVYSSISASSSVTWASEICSFMKYEEVGRENKWSVRAPEMDGEHK